MRLVQDLVLFVCFSLLIGSQLPADVSTPLLSLWDYVSQSLAAALR